ncbi:hypothetical protein C2G38_2051205 [Gigaspora rosea]|uniref:Uncharacterized protein n=1 Tax=Gigaspora rosea TaxID=44941 RepID=A0A397TVW6_9GLOM|nr:hypothetical protein C2G38_2051205 [Gigaspora rosea]
MEDPELEAIRQARICEFQAAAAALIHILGNEARERLARISIVKVEKARTVEDLLIRMARPGRLRGKNIPFSQTDSDNSDKIVSLFCHSTRILQISFAVGRFLVLHSNISLLNLHNMLPYFRE